MRDEIFFCAYCLYNEGHTIASCIESILCQEKLGNSYEIIVVDDGSNDDTSIIVKDLSKNNKHVKLIGDGRNHGRGYGRFKGVEASQGKFVLMVDADIVLPSHWLSTCLKYIQTYNVVGGVAVPDGDVAYIYRRFELKPKTVMGSTTITGNNGMYRRAIFSKVTFDKTLREGEDVEFNHRASAAGFSMFCIPGLSVEHQETKSLPRSMLWLYQSGIGATRQLLRFHEVRLPDLAFTVTLCATILALVLVLLTDTVLWFVAPVLALLGASFMHVRSKFVLSSAEPTYLLAALGVDTLLILCYYIGRCIGPFALLRKGSSK